MFLFLQWMVFVCVCVIVFAVVGELLFVYVLFIANLVLRVVYVFVFALVGESRLLVGW